MGTKEKPERFPLRVFHWKTEREAWKCSLSSRHSVRHLMTFRSTLKVFLLRHADALRVTNITKSYEENSAASPVQEFLQQTATRHDNVSQHVANIQILWHNDNLHNTCS